MSSTEDHISVILDDPQSVNNLDSDPSSSQGKTKLSNIPTVASNMNIYLLPVSENIAKRLFRELFDNPDEKFTNTTVLSLQRTCFVLSGLIGRQVRSKEKTYDLYVMHLIIMTKFVLENPDKARAPDFIKFYNSQPESKEYPLEETATTYYINYVFCSLLIIKVKNEDMLFKDVVYSAFPRGRDVLSHKRKNLKPFPSVNRGINLSMDKMKNFLLDIEVTTYLDEHFDLKGHKIWIYSYEFECQELMRNYKDNRVAQLYGIETVGMEVLKTYTSLINSKESKDIIFEYKIWRGFYDFDEAIFKLNDAWTKDLGYTVLADKFFRLERKINSFWFRFQRETSHRRLYQPVDYYFIIFSVFLGILTIVQTISGIISLILQAKSS